MTKRVLIAKWHNKPKKSKPKMTDRDRCRLELEWREHNRWLRVRHQPVITFNEFVQQKTGKVRVQKNRPDLEMQPKAYRRETPIYKSADDGIGVALQKETPVYSGERTLLGVAAMHKSNYVPVFDSESAKDLAKMRR